jgi:hypothetical protein
MKQILTLTMLLSLLSFTKAQIITSFASTEVIATRGKFNRDFRVKNSYVIPARDTRTLLRRDSIEKIT